jgi:hypothetical protein
MAKYYVQRGNIMIKILIATLTMLATLNAGHIQLAKGWNLKGMPSDADTSIFNKYCVRTVWKYDNGNWSIYTQNDDIKALAASAALNQFDTINKFDGMWIETYETCQLPYQEEVLNTKITEPTDKEETPTVCNIDPIFIADGDELPEASQLKNDPTPIALNTVYKTKVKYTDYYEVDVKKGHRYALSLTNGKYSYSTIYATVWDPNGNVALNTFSIATDLHNEASFSIKTDGKAIVYIQGTNGKDHDINLAVYSATEDGLKHDEDTFEPNGTSAVSYPLVFDQEYSSSIVEGETYDTYRFNVKKGKSYSVEISNLNDSEGNIYFTGIYSDAEVKYLVSGYTIPIGTSMVRTFTASKDSTVHVYLGDGTSKNNDDYTIVATQETGYGHNHDTKTYEPNSSKVSAYPIAFNTAIDTTLDARTDSQDVYVIDAKKGNSYTVRLVNKDTGYSAINVKAIQANTGALLLNGYSYDSYDADIGSVSAWTFTNDKPDSKVYITVWSDDLTKQNDYTIAVESNDEGLVHDKDTLEPNDSSGSAYPIEINKVHKSSLLANTDYEDVYVIDGKAGYSYTLDIINNKISSSAINVKVIEANTNELLINGYSYESYDIDIESVKAWTFDMGIKDSKIYIYLWSDDKTKQNDYTIAINSNDEGLVHDTTTYEPNQLKPDAYPLLVGVDTTTISSKLEILDSNDSFVFNAPANSKYKLTITNKDTGYSSINISAYQANTNELLINGYSYESYDVDLGTEKVWTFENSTGNPSNMYIHLWSDDQTKQNDYTFTLEKIVE